MSELRTHGRELLDAARRERTPSPAEKARVRGALSNDPASAFPGRALGAGPAKWLLLGAVALLLLGAYLLGR